MNVVEELDRIIRLADAAKAALADEHEGNLRAAVTQMHTVTGDLHSLVSRW